MYRKVGVERLLFILLILSTCALSQEFTFDMDLIREWNQDSKLSKPIPYVYRNKKDGREIRYIAVRHTNNHKSDTFKIIKRTIKIFKPHVVIIEGVPSSLGYSEFGLVEQASNCKANRGKCSEAFYAAKFATKKGIQFQGGEPDTPVQIDHIAKNGLTTRDANFFFIARDLFSHKRDGEIKESDLKAFFESEIARYDDPTKAQNSYESFMSWFKDATGNDFSFENLKNEDYAPLKSGHKLNKISALADEVREKNILKTIEVNLNLKRKVLVVYGSSHLYKHQEVLDDAFRKERVNRNVDDSNRGIQKQFEALPNLLNEDRFIIIDK